MTTLSLAESYTGIGLLVLEELNVVGVPKVILVPDTSPTTAAP